MLPRLRVLVLATLLLLQGTVVIDTLNLVTLTSTSRTTRRSFTVTHSRTTGSLPPLHVTLDDLKSAKESYEFVKTLIALPPRIKENYASEVIDEIDFRLNRLDIRSLVQVVYLFTSLPISENNTHISGIIQDSFQQMIRAINDGGFDVSSPKPMSQFFQGIAASGRLNWRSLSIEDRTTILDEIQGYMTSCLSIECDQSHFRHVNDILISLGKISTGIQNDISPAFKTIFHSFVDAQIESESVPTSKMLMTISNFHVVWPLLPSKLHRTFLAAIEKDIALLEQDEFVRVVSALAKMKFDLTKTGRSFQLGFLSVMTSQVALFGERNLCQLLQGLGKMGYKWSYFTKPTMRTISQRIIDISPLSMQGISAIFTALKRLDVQWNLLSQDLRNALLSSLPDSQACTEQVVANILYSLGGMNANWTTLPADDKEKIILSVRHIAKDLTSQGLSNTMWGLSKMEYSGERIPELEDKIRKVIPILIFFTQNYNNHSTSSLCMNLCRFFQ